MAPAAGIPLAALVLFWFLPRLVHLRTMPFEVSPLLGFALSAALAGLLALFLEIHPFKGETVVSRQAEAWLTLGLGLAFYLVTVSFVSDRPGRLRISLAWILAGLVVALLWSGVQAYFVLCCDGEIPYQVRQVHRLVSTRDPIGQRVTGLAFEPSWFAHQLNTLYFPICLAGLVTGGSVLRRRLLGISVEWVLLAGSIAALGLSTSRIGLVGFIAIAGLAATWLTVRTSMRLNRALQERISRWLPGAVRVARSLAIAFVWLGILVAFAAVTIGIVLVAARLDWRWERILAPPDVRIFSLEYANYMLFSERAVYWTAAYRVFEGFPLLGVGLGNVGFFIPEVMPAFAWALPEVVEVLDPGTGLFPNAKSLWLRLLAETGVIGFSFFAVWLLLMAAGALRLSRNQDRLKRMVGAMGLFSLVAFVVEGFSVDSFAFPYFWVAMGLVTAAGRIASANAQRAL